MSTDVLMVRIYLSEADHGRRKTLTREILSTLHDRHAVKGVTVFRGVAGFGADGEVHADDMLRLNVDLPLVVEFFDEPPAAEAAIHLLETMVAQGHIVSWPAKRHGAAVPHTTANLSSMPGDQILMAGCPTHVARMFRGCPRSLPVQGVSVPRPGRARPGASSRPWDGGGRRSARRRIALS
jgi:uncharacterized protein